MQILQETAASNDIYAELIKAFHLMWDCFPSSASLLKKDRTVLACNPAAAERGYEVGAKCFHATKQTSVHKQCKANEAMREQTAQRELVYNATRNTVSEAYWFPVPGHNDVYLHAVINLSEYAKPELFKE